MDFVVNPAPPTFSYKIAERFRIIAISTPIFQGSVFRKSMQTIHFSDFFVAEEYPRSIAIVSIPSSMQ
jgi:hypothetical protein